MMVNSKMLIYGRNATGKTNLGRALTDIRYTMFNVPGFISDNVFLMLIRKKNLQYFLMNSILKDKNCLRICKIFYPGTAMGKTPY